MAADTSAQWEPVEAFGSAGEASERFDLVDVAVRMAGVGVRRFQSGAGRRAVLVPVAQMRGEPLLAVGLYSEVTHVLFLDAVPAEGVTGLLRAVGEPTGSVRVAVAGTAAPAGLTVDNGRIDAGPAPTISFPVYRVVDGPRIAPGPRIGESPDVTGERSRWFGARHSGPDA